MGLDVSHDCWQGSYSAFNTWRWWLAKRAGFNLNEMQGFGGFLEWNRADNLTILLDHSDCEGSIDVKDCAPLAERLQELLPNDSERITNALLGEENEDWKIEALRQFIKGLRLADECGEDVEFG